MLKREELKKDILDKTYFNLLILGVFAKFKA